MPRRLLPLAGFLFPDADALQAQGTRRDTVDSLTPITVTATRSGSAILTTPLSVTRIGGEQLRTMRGYGLEDALRMVPGVLAQSRSAQDVRIVIRGFGARGAGDRSNAGTSRGIRILLDGIPETEPDGRTSFDDIDLVGATDRGRPVERVRDLGKCRGRRDQRVDRPGD